MFVIDWIFQPSLMFVGKARPQPEREHLKGSSLWLGEALPANIGIAEKACQGQTL